jgi:hypothetical protein
MKKMFKGSFFGIATMMLSLGSGLATANNATSMISGSTMATTESAIKMATDGSIFVGFRQEPLSMGFQAIRLQSAKLPLNHGVELDGTDDIGVPVNAEQFNYNTFEVGKATPNLFQLNYGKSNVSGALADLTIDDGTVLGTLLKTNMLFGETADEPTAQLRHGEALGAAIVYTATLMADPLYVGVVRKTAIHSHSKNVDVVSEMALFVS